MGGRGGPIADGARRGRQSRRRVHRYRGGNPTPAARSPTCPTSCSQPDGPGIDFESATPNSTRTTRSVSESTAADSSGRRRVARPSVGLDDSVAVEAGPRRQRHAAEWFIALPPLMNALAGSYLWREGSTRIGTDSHHAMQRCIIVATYVAPPNSMPGGAVNAMRASRATTRRAMTGPLSFSISADQEALVNVARGFGERRLAAVLQATRAGRCVRSRDIAGDGRPWTLRGRAARRVWRPRT